MAFLTHQQIFDNAVQHLWRQGSTAVAKNGGAATRGWDGRTCPIGALISISDYTKSMETVSVRLLMNLPGQMYPASMDHGLNALRAALTKAKIDVSNNHTLDLLSKLQNCHDVFGVWEWDRRLRGIADLFGLTYNRTV